MMNNLMRALSIKIPTSINQWKYRAISMLSLYWLKNALSFETVDSPLESSHGSTFIQDLTLECPIFLNIIRLGLK